MAFLLTCRVKLVQMCSVTCRRLYHCVRTWTCEISVKALTMTVVYNY